MAVVYSSHIVNNDARVEPEDTVTELNGLRSMGHPVEYCIGHVNGFSSKLGLRACHADYNVIMARYLPVLLII